MGVWLWDHHLGTKYPYQATDSQIALQRIDRDLRLADGARDMPAFFRRMIGIESIEDTITHSVSALDLLGRDHALTQDGAYALVVLDALKKGNNPALAPFSSTGLQGPPNPAIVFRRFSSGDDAWWDRAYLLGIQQTGKLPLGLNPSGGPEDPRNRRLVHRAVIARGSVAALALVGLCFLPRLPWCLRRIHHPHPRQLPDRWPISLGLGVFLVAYLASVGFTNALNGFIRKGGPNHSSLQLDTPTLISLDLAARALPTLLALAFLFRHPSHASKRLGLFARPHLGLALACFGTLTCLDWIARSTLGTHLPPDPTGGLTPSDAGIQGLIFLLISTCIAAPIAEEILYRGILYRSLSNQIPLLPATIVASLVFASVHFYSPYGLTAVGLLGAACCLCLASTRSLSTAIILHFLYNISIKLPQWIVYQADR